MKYKSLIIFLYFGYTLNNQVLKSGVVYLRPFFWVTSGDWKTPKSLDFQL